MEMLAAVRKAVEATKDDVVALKSDLVALENAAGADGFAIGDDGSIANLWGYPASPSDDGGHQTAVNDARRAHERELVEAANTLMVRGDTIEDESAAAMLDAIDAAGIGRDGKPILGVNADSGRSDGEDARDGLLSEAAEARLKSLDLSRDQLDAIARGEQVIVTDHQMSYLRSFFDAAGKDGILALADNPANNDGNDARTTVAAAAAGLLTLSNEDVRTPSNQTGGFDKLPRDLQVLVGNRYWGADKSGSDADADRYARSSIDESIALGRLLNDPGAFFYTPGRDLALNLDRQVASLTQLDYLRNQYEYRELDASLRNYLEVGSRNHEASSILLSGAEPVGVKARDNFANVVFGHDWDDDGRSAAKIFGWTAEGAGEHGREGEYARTALKALPDIFVPTIEDGARYDDQKLPEGAGSFEQFANSFHSNPELADTLSKVVSNNLGSIIRPDLAQTVDAFDGTVAFSRDDGDRLIFLASQSETGLHNVIAANELYKNSVLNEAFRDPANPNTAFLYESEIMTLDERVTTNTVNAQTFRLGHDIADANEAAQHTYDIKRTIADRIADVAAVPIEQGVEAVSTRLGPAGPFAEALAGAGIDAAREGIITGIIGDEPEAQRVPLPDPKLIAIAGERQILDDMLQAAAANGYRDESLTPIGVDGQPVPVSLTAGTNPGWLATFTRFIGSDAADFASDYGTNYKIGVGDDVAKELTQLEIWLTGNQ